MFFVKILKSPDVSKFLLDRGTEPVGNSVADFTRQVRTESAKYGELAKRISVQRRNRIARAIHNAYNKMVKEDEDSGGSTPEQLSNILTTKRREPAVRHVAFNAPPDCITLMITGAVWALLAQSSGRAASSSDANF